MKIAFVGKGGSGKSTLSCLFINYLLKNKNKVLVIDADINMHVSGLLGIKRDPSLTLSDSDNAYDIRKYLKGSNSKIKEAGQMVKTTPPGIGSNLITLNKNDYIMSKYSIAFSEKGSYMHVGTYNSEDIGTACYHTNLAIFENILSHTILKNNEWLVADMVAGTDAFSNTLHAQFDAIILVIEPTPEGVSVYKQYINLAKNGGVEQSLYVIGNKIEDEVDLKYLQEKIGNRLLGEFLLKKEIKQARQRDSVLNLSILSYKEIKLFTKIIELIKKTGKNHEKKLRMLHNLHKKYVVQDYIVNAFGDITDQIDTAFHYPQK